METKNKKFNIIRFRITANRLLKMSIDGIEDVKKFYVGVNNLAFQIASNAALINKLNSLRYDDNQKLFKGIIHILAYGQVIGKSELFAQKSSTGLLHVKKINLDAFFEKNPWAERKIKNIQIRARIHLSTFKKLEENKKNKNLTQLWIKYRNELNKLVDNLAQVYKNYVVRNSGILVPSDSEAGREALSPVSAKDTNHADLINLCLNSDGDLWREPKEKYCYPMMKSGERLKIVRFFAENMSPGFIETQNIALKLDKKTQYIRSEIGKINRKAKHKLKLKVKMIEGKQGNGYRLNSVIKIKLRTR